MTVTIEEIREFLESSPYYDDVRGKVIAADVLVAYLFLNHDHHLSEDCLDAHRPYVESLTMEQFIRDHCV